MFLKTTKILEINNKHNETHVFLEGGGGLLCKPEVNSKIYILLAYGMGKMVGLG